MQPIKIKRAAFLRSFLGGIIMARRKAIKRENGTGSIYKRSDSKNRPWVAVAPAKYDSSYKPKRIVIGHFATAQEAKNALFQYNLNPTEKYNITVEQLFTEWSDIAYRNISKQTVDNYNACFNKIKPIYNIKFRELRTGQMQKIIDDNTNMSSSTLSKIKLLFTQLYKYALENDIVNKNYAEFIVLPKQTTTKKDSFTDLELAKIEQSVNEVPFADLIFVMCYSGFRISEFLELTPFSYDPKAQTLTGGNKTIAGMNRAVPIHPKIQPIIEKWIAKNGDTIFCKEDGKKYSAKYFREKCYYPALRAIGIRELPPHCTRHTCATRLAAAGARPEDIQKILGHSDYEVTANTYIHQDIDTLKNAINLMA